MSAIATPPAPAGAPTPPPAATGPKPWKWTREQYTRLFDLGFFVDKRVELIFGEIIEMSKQGWPHVVACRKVAEFLARTFAGAGWLSEQRPFSAGGSEPVPDAAMIPGRFEDYQDHPTAALLIVEVADSTLAHDTTTKAELYATAGVPEYWVLDLEHRQLIVFRDPQPLSPSLDAVAYQTRRTLSATDTVSPLRAPSVTLTVADLLP
jgi:Uma2 family endonuclease